jgi:hypothetical protein
MTGGLIPGSNINHIGAPIGALVGNSLAEAGIFAYLRNQSCLAPSIADGSSPIMLGFFKPKPGALFRVEMVVR